MTRTKKESTTNKPVKQKNNSKFQNIRGFRDILPENQKFWNHLFDNLKCVTQDHSYKRVDTPVVENLVLYEKAFNQSANELNKDLFVMSDGGKKIALRPDIKPSLIRAYFEHHMISWSQPIKFWYLGPVFKFDKEKEAKHRQSHQLGFEIMGGKSADIDSNLIILVYNFFKSLGLEIKIEINSIGCPECRKNYIKLIKKFIKEKKVCASCRKNVDNHPIQIFTCEDKRCKEAATEAPQLIDSLCEGCKNNFVKVLENVDESEVEYNLNPILVRDQDFYNRTIFDVYLKEDEVGPTNLLASGGRHDYLAQRLTGDTLPAIGWWASAEKIILKLREKNVKIKEEKKCDVFVAQLGEPAKKKGVKLFNDLRKQGIKVKEAFTKSGLTEQMEIAVKSEVKYTVILGQKEIMDNTAIIRNMESGVQEIVQFEKVIDELKKRLLGQGGVKIYNNGHGSDKITE